jgi:5-methyltetrahydropteroyltriglutamate--homocysteine methyltransferase
MASRGCFLQGVTDHVYATRHDLLRDLLPIYQDEMRALAADGVAYVQMDEGFISYVNDNWREGLRDQGLDPEQELAADIAAENACWDLLPPDRVTRAMHICRGSRTTERGSGGYEWLAEHLFGQLHVERFLLEYDSDLVGGFEPLRFLPRDKTVVLGLVTSKDPRLENEDLLLRRIDEAARYAPVDQLAISPQCGFGGSADNAFMTLDEQWQKLELIARVADRVWGGVRSPT